MRIIIDAMGGDNAPKAIVAGAIDAAREFGVDMILVGHGESILRCLNEIGLDNLPKGIEVANADDVVTMEDDPASVMREHRGSSMVLGLKMLAEGRGDAFISAGNTGALLTAATLTVKRIKGVRRAAFGPVVPTKGGSAVLSVLGTNMDGSWTAKDATTVELTFDGSSAEATLEGEELVMQQDGDVMRFKRGEIPPVASEVQRDENQAAEPEA